ncbi:MAG TPA: hypothetical protein VFL59_10340 [Candidatus Nanopelagicales bacterium]|nr:hypothetical protein [Candidatus Nanopelagicales bacterium]
MNAPSPEQDLLRQMVRQVLQEIVPATTAGAGATDAVEPVSVTCDAELTAFARKVAGATPEVRDAILAGRTTFRLTPAAGAPAPASTAVVHVEKGAVTERHVREAKVAGARLVLGRRAVLTPLARDRARTAGVEIMRED